MYWIKRLFDGFLFVPKRLLNALFGYDFFISYAHGDGREYPNALDAALRAKYTVHLDTRDYRVGQDLRVLTRLRVRNSRVLVVVGRPEALTRSYWVRKEVEAFYRLGRTPVVIDVDRALESALASPPQDSLAEWFARLAEKRADGRTVNPMLVEVDSLDSPVVPRLPQAHVAQRLQQRFSGDRVETRRLRVVTAGLLVLFLATGAAVLQTSVAETQRQAALTSLAQSKSNELASRARVISGSRPDLGLVLATRSISTAREAGVSWVEGASALRDIFDETQGARSNCLEKGEGQSIDYSNASKLLAVATDASALCLFRRSEGGALRLLDTLQSFGTGFVDTVHFSNDGAWLVTHMHDGPLRVLPVGNLYGDNLVAKPGQANYKFSTFGTTQLGDALSFDSANDRIAFYSETSDTVEVWRLSGQGPTAGAEAKFVTDGDVLATSFDPSGKFLAALVHESRTRRQVPDGEQGASDLGAQPDFVVEIWSTKDSSLVSSFAVLEQRDGVYFGDGVAMGELHGQLRLARDAEWVAPALSLADDDRLEPQLMAQVFRVADHALLANFAPKSAGGPFDGWERLTDIGFSDDGQSFFGLSQSVIRYWSLPTDKEAGPLRRFKEFLTPSTGAGARRAQGVVSAITVSRDGHLLATVDSTDSLTVWDSKQDSGTEPLIFVSGIGEASGDAPTAVAFSTDAKEVFFASANGEVRVCDVGSRCGPIVPMHLPAPSRGTQWKQFITSSDQKWIAAVSDAQLVSFFRAGDLREAAFDVSLSDEPAPVTVRSYAVLSGTPGRPVATIFSTDGSWAAVFEQDQYGFDKTLRLVRLAGDPVALDVKLSSDCDSFAYVAFDPFAPYVVLQSAKGCVGFGRLPASGLEPVVITSPAGMSASDARVDFRKNHMLVVSKTHGQLWDRDSTGAPGRLLLEATDGPLALTGTEDTVVRARAHADNGLALTKYHLTATGDLGPPEGIGNYASVDNIEIRGAISLVVGTHSGASEETVAVWPTDTWIAPLLERTAEPSSRGQQIMFDPALKRAVVGPVGYALDKAGRSPRNVGVLLFDLSNVSRLTAQVLPVDLGVEQEDCTMTMGAGDESNSCYDLQYTFSSDARWLMISRDQDFGPPGPATLWNLQPIPTIGLSFPAGTSVEFDSTSQWLLASTETEQRLWSLNAKSMNWTDRGRVAPAGWSSFAPGPSSATLLTGGQISVEPLDIDELLTRVADYVGRNLTLTEWADLFPGAPFDQLFASLPPSRSGVIDLLNRSQALADAGQMQMAATDLSQAARLAVKVGSAELCIAVVQAAQEAGIPSSAKDALEFVEGSLPNDPRVKKLVDGSGTAKG